MKQIFKGIFICIVLFSILMTIPNVNPNEVKNSIFMIGNIDYSVKATTIEEDIKNSYITTETDLRILSNFTEQDYNQMLQGTELENLGYCFVQVEKDYQINGLYLLGLCCLESGYGTSGYARNRNNLVGWNAVDSNPDLATYFESKEQCILFVSQKLRDNYLNENGCYFEGYSASAIDVHYCTDKEHARKIVQIINNLLNKIER